MTKQGILGVFGSHAFLDGLSDQHLMRLGSAVKTFAARPTEVLARKGHGANAFYLIQSGHVEIGNHNDDGEFSLIAEVGPGEAVGWSWILPPHRWEFDCRAADSVQGLSLDAEWLRDQCETDHELGYHLLKHLLAMLANRLASTRLAAAPNRHEVGTHT
jgi:CRP/FNR family cyclic AMP-dependent transcriptional regulator